MSEISLGLIDLALALDTYATGCGEGYCIFSGHAKGMHTNGGCQCLSRVRPPALKMLLQRKMRERLKAEEAGRNDG